VGDLSRPEALHSSAGDREQRRQCPVKGFGVHLLVPGAQSKRVGKVRRDIPKFSKNHCSQCVVASRSKQEEARNVGAVCYVPKSDAVRELLYSVKAPARGESSAAS
jgi:hypothetical protein